jgi:hypothetical protein
MKQGAFTIGTFLVSLCILTSCSARLIDATVKRSFQGTDTAFDSYTIDFTTPRPIRFDSIRSNTDHSVPLGTFDEQKTKRRVHYTIEEGVNRGKQKGIFGNFNNDLTKGETIYFHTGNKTGKLKVRSFRVIEKTDQP